MIEETAVVKSIESEWVDVLTTQSSGCNQCNEADSCSTSVLAKFFGEKEISLRLQSGLLLKPGDRVVLGIEEKNVYRTYFSNVLFATFVRCWFLLYWVNYLRFFSI